MREVSTRARLLARAEMLYMRVAARAAVRQIVLLLVAWTFVCLAVVMLTVAAFLALSELYGAIYGALLTGLGLLLLSFLLLFGASRAGRGPEQRLALELREIARKEMAAEIAATGQWAREGLSPSGLAGLAALLLRPLIARLLRSKRRGERGRSSDSSES